jgi:FKBP-type peptidyl-prolyl cis-trans isomerase
MEEEAQIEMEAQPAPPAEWGEDISPDKDGKLYKKILNEGSGDDRPAKGDEVYVHYTGRLLDGSVFDSSVERNELFNFKLGEGKVIKGWDEGVATMRKGEKCLLTCSPDFAYGSAGAGEKIPPDSTLQFEVELFHWKGEDITNDGGVIMSVIEEGSGWKKPTDGSSVKVQFKGMYNENIIEDREAEFDLGEGSEHSIIEGIEKALEKMKENASVKLIIQPAYAFGESGDASKGVPPNAEVTYIVKLVSFVKAKQSYEYDDLDSRINDATAIKEKGTTYFKAGKFALALKLYKRGLGIVEKSSVYKDEEKESTRVIRVMLQLNLAMCHLKLNSPVEARDACEQVIEEDEKNVKAHFRRGQSFEMMQDYEEALKCFQGVMKIESTNRAAYQQIQACRQKIKQQREKDKKLYANMFEKLSRTR